ncbi:MAG: hypothetical protein WAU28_03220 [Candidatus Moraniibacteriota bacterium]
MPLKKGFERQDIENLLSHYTPRDIMIDMAYDGEDCFHSRCILSEEDERIQVAGGRLPEVFVLHFIVQTGEVFRLGSLDSGMFSVLGNITNFMVKRFFLAPNVLECCLKQIDGIDGKSKFVVTVKDQGGTGNLIARADFDILLASKKTLDAKVAERKALIRQWNGG